jgi:hypothetical protein
MLINPLSSAEITSLLTKKPKAAKVKKRREMKADTWIRDSDGNAICVPFAQLKRIQIGTYDGRAKNSRKYLYDGTVISYPCGKIVK